VSSHSSARTTDLDSAAHELAELRLQLWSARDAARGAIAEAGAIKARNAELEALIGQLRAELSRLATLEQSKTYRAGKALTAPLRIARNIAR